MHIASEEAVRMAEVMARCQAFAASLAIRHESDPAAWPDD